MMVPENTELHVDLKALLAEDNRAAVDAFWESHFRLYDGATEPLIETARFWIARGMPNKALDFLQKAKDLGHRAEEIILVQAHARRRIGEPEESLDMLFQISKAGEESPELLLALASTYCDLRMKSEAQAKLQPILLSRNQTPESKLVFAKWFYLSGHYAKSLNLAIQGMSDSETRLEAGAMGIMAAEKLGQTGRLRSLLQKLLHHYPTDPEVLALTQLFQPEMASQHQPVASALAQYPRHIGLMAAQIRESVLEKDLDTARKQLYQAIDRAEWHEWVQQVHLEYAFAKGPKDVDWTFFEELCESGKYPGLFQEFIRFRRQLGYHPEVAREYLEGALSQAPEGAMVVQLFAEQLIEEGNLKAAFGQWLQVVTLSPWNPEGWCQIGREYMRQERWGEAKSALEKALTANAIHPMANLSYAELLYRSEQFEDALRFAKVFAEQRPEVPEGREWVAKIRAAAGQGDEAWDLIWNAWYLGNGQDQQLLEQLRDMAQSPEQQACYWVRTGEPARAVELLQDKDARTAMENYWGANALAAVGEFRMALSWAMAGWDQAPDSPFLQGDVLRLNGILGRRQDVNRILSRVQRGHYWVEYAIAMVGKEVMAWEEGPSCPEIWLLEAIGKGVEHPDAALENYKRILQVHPGGGEALGVAAILLEQSGIHGQQLESWTARIWEERSVQGGYILGKWLVGQKGREAEGIRMLSMVVEDSPEFYAAAFALAEAWIAAYRISPALGVLGEMKDAQADNGWIWEVYGRAWHAQGKHDQALKAYRQAADKEPERPEIQYGLAKVLLDSKAYDLAPEQFALVSEMEGLTPEMHFGCAQAFQLLDQPEKAVLHAQRALAALQAAAEDASELWDPVLLDKVEHFMEKWQMTGF